MPRAIEGLAIVDRRILDGARQFGDSGILKGNDLPFAIFPRCHDSRASLHFARLASVKELQMCHKVCNSHVGTHKTDTLEYHFVAAALIDGVQNHAMGSFNCSASV